MIPLLIVSNDDKLINNHIDKFKHDALFFEVHPSTKEYSIEDIKNLKKMRKREKYQQEDLADNEELLPHLEAVYDYFGGNLK